MKVPTLFAGVAVSLLVYAAPLSAAGDAEAGRIKALTCMGCHGIDTYSNAYPTYRVPKLGGQHAEYIVAALNAYRSGARGHKSMQSQVAALTDQDVQDIAAFLTQAPEADRLLAFPWLHPKPDDDVSPETQKLAAPCAACHEPDGVPANKIYPILAGQYPNYLERALKEYRDGGRENPIMKPMVANLSDEDIEKLADYFAALPGPLRTPTTNPNAEQAAR